MRFQPPTNTNKNHTPLVLTQCHCFNGFSHGLNGFVEIIFWKIIFRALVVCAKARVIIFNNNSMKGGVFSLAVAHNYRAEIRQEHPQILSPLDATLATTAIIQDSFSTGMQQRCGIRASGRSVELPIEPSWLIRFRLAAKLVPTQSLLLHALDGGAHWRLLRKKKW